MCCFRRICQAASEPPTLSRGIICGPCQAPVISRVVSAATRGSGTRQPGALLFWAPNSRIDPPKDFKLKSSSRNKRGLESNMCCARGQAGICSTPTLGHSGEGPQGTREHERQHPHFWVEEINHHSAFQPLTPAAHTMSNTNQPCLPAITHQHSPTHPSQPNLPSLSRTPRLALTLSRPHAANPDLSVP